MTLGKHFSELDAAISVLCDQRDCVEVIHLRIVDALVAQGWVDDDGVMKSPDGSVWTYKKDLISRLTSGSIDANYCRLVVTMLNSGWELVDVYGCVSNANVPGVIISTFEAIESCICVGSGA